MPITLLEIATVGFAIPSLATFLLWFSKPKDIEVPTFIDCLESTPELLARTSPPNFKWEQTPLDFIDTVNSPSFTSHIILKTEKWPGRTNFEGESKRIRNDVFALKYTILDQVFVGIVWIGYAAVHLSAWSFAFPTKVEQIAWRVACLTMTGSMLVFWVTSNRRFYQLLGFLWPWKRKELAKIVGERKKISTTQILLGAFGFSAYLSARICLIVLVFMALRRMPVGVFETVDWTRFFPHI